MTEEVLLSRFETEEIGIFESMRTYSGRIFRVEEHLERLAASAKTAGFACPDGKRLRRELELAVKDYLKSTAKDIFIRLTLWQDRVFVIVGERVHPAALYEKGVALRTSPVPRNLSNAWAPEAKTSAYQNAVAASLEPRAGEIYEWLFLDRNGFVTEVRIGNIFIVREGRLRTPPALGILNGVTRRFVIECARKTGIPVGEIPLTRHEVFNAGEAFLTNTSWEILPIAELDGRKIGKTIPGPMTRQLQQVFEKRVKEECS